MGFQPNQHLPRLSHVKAVRYPIWEGMLPVKALFPVDFVVEHNQERLVDKSIIVQPHHHWGSNNTNTYLNQALSKL